MGFEQRRVIVGYQDNGLPIYKMLSAKNQDEMNVKIVQSFIDSGRIYELLPSLQYVPSASNNILLKEYAKQWLQRKRKLKETTSSP